MKNELVTNDYGSKFWYKDGKLHREDGPAAEYSSGTKYWFLNGKKHREDGPAVEWEDGHKSWYLNGKQVNEEELFKYEINKMFDEIEL